MKTILILVAGLAACQAYDYGEVIRLSTLFYEAQRSGKLPSDQRVTWRKDSALNDKGQNGEDLTGGYFDAGDFVKFGFPMAFTVTVLSWGMINHANGYNKANAMSDAQKSVKWATDYLLKAHVSENKLYIQVGDGNLDHASWGRPEDMTMQRPSYYVDPSLPGSDVAGETAAAFAAASIVFKNVDSSYSNTLLTHAKQLYNFAMNYRGYYSVSVPEVVAFYNSTAYDDELIWAAAWMYKATNDQSYLQKAEQLYSESTYQYWIADFSWDNKAPAVELLLAELTGQSLYVNKVKSYCDKQVNTQKKTPKGLLYIYKWGPLRWAANAVFLCLEAKSLGMDYTSFGKQQIGYMLGDTGRSFVGGYGNNPPTHEHHRSSDCPDAPATCDWNTYNSASPNAHVLYGALVGGPDENDNYYDDRTMWEQNEPGCDYNAGFQGALAMLNEL